MASLFSGLFGIAGLLAAGCVIILPAYWICREKLSFASFLALPLGSLVPWIAGMVVVMAASPFVLETRQQGYGWAPVFLFIGAMTGFVICSYVGAYFGVGDGGLLPRALTGMKWTALFATAVVVWIMFMAFHPDA